MYKIKIAYCHVDGAALTHGVGDFLQSKKEYVMWRHYLFFCPSALV